MLYYDSEMFYSNLLPEKTKHDQPADQFLLTISRTRLKTREDEAFSVAVEFTISLLSTQYSAHFVIFHISLLFFASIKMFLLFSLCFVRDFEVDLERKVLT